ncbi:MAG TPA: histidine phosphatase family protein [Candidatus Limnocylindrales bacterium]|jgi:broad specificity phosphatase PhoE
MELVYETHAITTDNEAGIATGWLPGVLSAAGRRTAAELGDRRRRDGIVAVYASDLARAVETARIAFEGTAIPIRLDPRLRECNYGRLNGMPRDRLDLERTRHLDEPWPDGESYADVVARTGDLLVDLVPQWDGARILVIAHSANQWALDHLLLGADMAERIAAGMTWQPGWEYVLG